MNTDDLITLILSLPDVRQAAASDKREFRVAGRLFANLVSSSHLALRLTGDQQRQVMQSDPEIFSSAGSSWGKRGWTHAAISALDEASALSALTMAWANAAPGRQPAPAGGERKS